MPITADQVTIAQYFEPEANVDLVTELTVNAGAEVLLPTPGNQNDNRMSKASFAQWILQTGTIGGALTGTPGASSYVVSNGTGSDATIGLVAASGNAGLMSGDDKTKLDGVADNANAYVHPPHSGHVVSVGDGNTTIQPGVVELSMLAADAQTNLGNTPADTSVLISSSTGTDTTIVAADGVGDLAGIMPAVHARKAEDTAYVTDYDADRTGNTDAGPAIQTAINDAVARRIGTVKFPRGLYQVDTKVDIPWNESDSSYKLILDFGGSRVRTSSDITMFERATTWGVGNLLKWPLTIKDGFFQQSGTKGEGTAFNIQNQQMFSAENCTFNNLRTSLQLNFCMQHHVKRCNSYGCTNPYIVRGMIGQGGSTYNSNSNSGLWEEVRADTDDAAAVGFDFYNCSGITLHNCISEGDAANIPLRITGSENGTEVLQDRHYRIVQHWFEGLSTLTGGTLIQLDDVQRSNIYINPVTIAGFANNPTLVALGGSLSTRSRRNIIHVDATTFCDLQNGAGIVWFNGDVQAGVDSRNYWKFTNCHQSANNKIDDPSRWTGGNVPTIDEDSWDKNQNVVRNNRLTIPANSMLVNSDPNVDGLVKPISSGALPTASRDIGAVVFGWDSSGNLAEFDAAVQAAPSRKDGIDDLGTQTGSTYTIDFDAGTYDNKEIELGNSIGITLSATRSGRYRVRFKQDVTGRRFVSLVATNVSPWITLLPLNTEPEAITVVDFEYQHHAVDNTKQIWHW